MITNEQYAERYGRAMSEGASEYADVLDALREHGLTAEFTQTGGMCAALSVQLEGAYLLITDQQDSLSWDRAAHEGWLVGRYREDGDTQADGYVETADGSVDALLPVIDDALAGRWSFTS